MNDCLQSKLFKASILIFFLYVVFIILTPVFLARPIYSVKAFDTTADFVGFYEAVTEIWDGLPLNFRIPFFKPPLFAIFISFFTLLPRHIAALIYSTLTLASFLTIVLIILRKRKQSFWVYICLIFVTIFSYPFSFEFDRQNVDFLSLGLTFFAYILMSKNAVITSLFLFAIAINFKTNVLIFLPGLLIAPKLLDSFKHLAIFIIICLVLMGLTPEWNITFFDILLERANLDNQRLENGSLFAIFLGSDHGELIAYSLLAITVIPITIGLIWDAYKYNRFTWLDRFLFLLPLSAAYPKLVMLYCYALFPFLLLLYCPFSNYKFGKLSHFARPLGCIGVLTACYPAGFLSNLFKNDEIPFVPPAIGLLMILLANLILVWDPMIKYPSNISKRSNNYSVQLVKVLEKISIALISFIAIFSVYFSLKYFALNQKQVLWFPPVGTAKEGRLYKAGNFYVKSIYEGWGRVRFNVNVLGSPLVVNGNTYKFGLGVHATTEFKVTPPQGAKTLLGKCAVDDASMGKAAGLKFIIKRGEQILFESPEMKSYSAPIDFNIDLTDHKGLNLRVEPTTKNNEFNYGDWLELRME